MKASKYLDSCSTVLPQLSAWSLCCNYKIRGVHYPKLSLKNLVHHSIAHPTPLLVHSFLREFKDTVSMPAFKYEKLTNSGSAPIFLPPDLEDGDIENYTMREFFSGGGRRSCKSCQEERNLYLLIPAISYQESKSKLAQRIASPSC